MSIYRPDTLQILDLAHAAEHLSQLLEALRHVGLHVPDRMLDRCLHVLKHRGPAALLRMANRLGSDLTQQKGIGQHLEYLRKRAALMQYPTFRAQGWPIGSEMVECANKLVMQARLKGAGMHWQRSHVNPMLALRLAVCNDRWQEMWHHAVRQQRIRIGHAPPQSTPTEPEDQVLLVDDRHAQTLPSPHAPAASVPHVHPSAPQRRSVTALHAPVSPSPMLVACSSRQGPDPLTSPSEKTPPQPADRCFCGAPLVRFKGHRPKEYCSDRCRQRAYRQRQTMKHWGHRRSIVSG